MRLQKQNSTLLLSLTLLLTALLLTSAVAAAKVSVSVFYADGAHGYPRWVQAGLDQFNAQNPDIEAILVTGNIDRLVTLVASGNPPDLIHGPGDRYIPEWAHNQLIQPLDPFLQNDPDPVLAGMVPSIFPILSWNDQLYGLPRNWAVGGIVSDVELFEERGVALPDPNWTQSDMIEIAHKLTHDSSGDGTVDSYGFTEAYGSAHRFPAWLWASGGDIWNEDMTQSTYDAPETLDALTFYENLWFKEGVSPWSYGGDTSSVRLWSRKAIGMAHELAQSIGIVVDQRPTFRSHISPLPVGSAGPDAPRQIAVIDYLTMYKETPHPNEAWEVLKYLTSEEGIEAGMDLTPLMGYQTSLSPHVSQLRETLLSRDFEENPLQWIDLAAQMRGTSMKHPVLGSNNVIGIIGAQMRRVRDGDIPMTEAATEIARLLNASVSEAISDGARW